MSARAVSSFLLLLIAGCVGVAHAQLPEIHYLRFNEAVGPLIDEASPGVPGAAPSLNGTARRTPGADALAHPSRGSRGFMAGVGSNDVCRMNAPLSVSGDWTLELWLRDDLAPTDTSVRYAFGEATAGNFRLLRGGPAGAGNLLLRGPLADTVIPGASVQGTWVHVAIVYDSVNQLIRPRVDGEFVAAVPQPSPVVLNGSDPAGLALGGHGTLQGNWEGAIDDFRFWSHARSGAQIQDGTTYEPTLVDTFPWVESFDRYVPDPTTISTTPPTGWRQHPEGSSSFVDWQLRTTGRAGVPSGPSADHSTGVAGEGFYARFADPDVASSAHLLTPFLDVSSLQSPELSLWYHSNNFLGADSSTLHLDVIEYLAPGLERDYLNVLGDIGHTGDVWTQVTLDLSLYSAHPIRVRIRARSDQFLLTHDIGIDDVIVRDAAAAGTPGQAPQAGLAVLEINGAVTAAGDDVASGAAGPYYAIASMGGTLDFTFEGVANQPIVLLAGDLLTAKRIFPNGIGQLDLDAATLIASGAGGGFPDVLFRTGATGAAEVSVPLPIALEGVLASFQAAIFNGGPNVVSFSNAVQVTVQ